MPQADENTMQKVLNNEGELNARVYNFPTSAIKQNDRKINYYDFIKSKENEDLNKAILRIFPRINMAEINNLIDAHHTFLTIKNYFTELISMPDTKKS